MLQLCVVILEGPMEDDSFDSMGYTSINKVEKNKSYMYKISAILYGYFYSVASYEREHIRVFQFDHNISVPTCPCVYVVQGARCPGSWHSGPSGQLTGL